MAEAPLSLNIAYFPDPTAGRPVANGSVYVGQPDLDPAVLANRVSVVVIQENGTRVTIAAAAQPLSTGAGGVILYNGSPVVVMVDGACSVKVLDSAGAQKYYAPRVNESATQDVNEGVLIINGSFENETQFTGVPDNWTLVAGTNGTIAVDDTDQAHGLKSLKFTGTDATGGGTATSAKFNVLEGGDLDIRFTYKSSAVDTLNKVEIKYYDASGSVVTTTTILSEGAANPTSYTSYIERVTNPAAAVQAELIITGVDGAGTTVAGTANFDDVSASPITENGVIETVHVTNAINGISVTDAITGNKPSLNQNGPEDNGIDIEGVELHNGRIVDAYGMVNGVVVGSTTISSVANNSTGTATVAHGFGDVAVDFGASISSSLGIGVFSATIGASWSGADRWQTIFNWPTVTGGIGVPTIADGSLGFAVRNEGGGTDSYTINWWVRPRQ